MRKRITANLCLLLMIAALLPSAGAGEAETGRVEPDTFVVNPGFETGDLTGWSAGALVTVEAAGAFEGAYGAVIATPPGDEGEGEFTQEISGLSPNTAYTLSARVKRPDRDSYLAIGVGGHGGDEAIGEASSTDWETLTVPFTTGQDHTTALISGYLWSGTPSGMGYFDDFSITVSGEDAPRSLANLDFETGDLTGWQAESAAVQNEGAYGGAYGAVIETPSYGWLMQEISGLAPNTTYSLSAMAKKRDPGSHLTIGVDVYGGPEVSATASGTDWELLMVTFTMDGSNTTARIYGEMSSGGIGYLDDFAVSHAEPIPAERIKVMPAFGPPGIDTKGGTRTVSAAVYPSNATNKAVTWAVCDESGAQTHAATIDENGVLTAVEDGVVRVVATARDGSGVSGDMSITITGQTGAKPRPAAYDFNAAWKGVVWDPFGWDIFSEGSSGAVKEIAGAGIRWVRIWLSEEKGTDWLGLDEMIRLCMENDVHIIACYNKTDPQHDLGTPEQQKKEADLLKAVVDRYGDYIRHWEIHNEPNLNSYWNDPDTDAGVARYVGWLQLAHDAIKEADPDATVILGGLSEWKMEAFMDRLTALKAYLYFDEVAFHPYAGNQNPVPAQVISRLNAFQEKMRAWPAPHDKKPVWITEIGFHVGDIGDSTPGSIPDKDGEPDEETKARYLYETMRLLISNLDAPRPISWYIYHEGNQTMSGYGLVRKYRQGSEIVTDFKPAYDVYRSMDKTWSEYRDSVVPATGVAVSGAGGATGIDKAG